jgi:hypothetical protein
MINLTVNPDDVAPDMISAEGTDLTHILVSFSKPLKPFSGNPISVVRTNGSDSISIYSSVLTNNNTNVLIELSSPRDGFYKVVAGQGLVSCNEMSVPEGKSVLVEDKLTLLDFTASQWQYSQPDVEAPANLFHRARDGGAELQALGHAWPGDQHELSRADDLVSDFADQVRHVVLQSAQQITRTEARRQPNA